MARYTDPANLQKRRTEAFLKGDRCYEPTAQ